MSARTWDQAFECDDVIADLPRHAADLAERIAAVREELAREKWQRTAPNQTRMAELASDYVPANPDQWEGLRVWKVRTDKGLTRAQLAARIGVSYGTVESWERDRSEPDAAMIERLVAIEQERRVA